jgi:two-component system KDP operon response regulator KdpE
MAQTILAIDDDPSMLAIVGRILSKAGYDVATAPNAEAGWRVFQERSPDLVLLDVMMPGVSGWELCERIRAVSTVPCIFLTARRIEADRVKGLDLGADDYIAKPFHADELRARVQAVLRRVRPAPDKPAILSFGAGGLVIDTARRAVRVNGQDADLTPTEYRLLVCLAEHPGQVLTTAQIFETVWHNETDALPANVKWYVWRLRQKIERDPGQPRFILTAPGVGYLFSDE